MYTYIIKRRKRQTELPMYFMMNTYRIELNIYKEKDPLYIRLDFVFVVYIVVELASLISYYPYTHCIYCCWIIYELANPTTVYKMTKWVYIQDMNLNSGICHETYRKLYDI